MAKPTIKIEYELTEGGGTYSDGFSSDVRQDGISFKYGFFNNKPTSPHVAGTGTMHFFFDNLSSDLPYTEPSSDGSVRGKGIGTRYRIAIDYDSDNLDTFYFSGRAVEWNVEPGLFGERVTEVVCEDYMGELARYTLNGLQVAQSALASTALATLTSDAVPYAPPAMSYSTNGETFTLVFHDIVDGVTKAIQAFSKIAESELGHVFCEGGTLYYMTNQDWLALGTSIGTLDNRFSAMEVSKNHELEYAPVFVNYYPATLGSTDIELVNYSPSYILLPSTSKTFRFNYRDPDNDSVTVTAIDVSPQYQTSASSDMPSSDFSTSFLNKGSSIEVVFNNTSEVYSVTITNITVTGQPVLSYDRTTVVSSDGNPFSTPLEVVMKYQDDIDFVVDAKDYLVEKYSLYPSNNTVQSVSFIATADSDMMTLAMKGKVGKSVTIVEDVNVINEPYIITSVAWDVYAPELIQVTWGLWPEERWARYFAADTDDTYMVDSDGNRFAYWR